MTGFKFHSSMFQFELNDKTLYSAHWTPNTTAPDLKRKYEVAIYRGGGYKISFYTDHQMNKTNSLEYIEKYLKSNQS